MKKINLKNQGHASTMAKQISPELIAEQLRKNAAAANAESIDTQFEIAERKSLKKIEPLTYDFRSTAPMPRAVRQAIEAHLAIDAEDAKSAGALGFMARALVIATMPYKDPKTDAFTRVNGDFKLRIVAGYEGGIPFGIYPRLLMSWVATEAVKKQTPVIELGDSLRLFLREVMDLRSTGGGSRGTSTRVTEQMKRLFGSLITAEIKTGSKKQGIRLKNVLIADELEIDENESQALDAIDTVDADGQILWVPQHKDNAGQWRSKVRLSTNFFKECIENPVPIDLRAYKALRESPLAMDVYTWLTYRMSYTTRRTRPIPWASLMMQFGSNYNTADLDQAVRNFKKAFLQALQLVLIVYPSANVAIDEPGLVLLPSRPHILPKRSQSELF